MLKHLIKPNWQLISLVLLCISAPCYAEQYPITAQFSNGEKFTGEFKPGFFHQEGSILLNSLNGTTHCYGSARTTFPSGPRILNCEKQRGIMTFQCDDGRYISANWFATSCSSGYGYGHDDADQKVSFQYGDKVNTHVLAKPMSQ